MHSSRINYALVGAFVLVIVVGLIGAVAVLTGRTGVTDRYHTVYDNVGGLKFGTPVTFEGYRVGQVERIEPTRTENGLAFRVELTVEQGFPIPQDSTAAVASSGLLAGNAIEISAGTAQRELEPGARIEPGASADVFAAVSRMAGQINELSNQGLKPLLAKLNGYTEELGEVLTARAPGLLDDLETASGTLAETAPRVARDVESFSTRLNDEVLGQPNLERIESTLANLENASRNLDQEVLGQANRTRVAETLQNLQTVSSEVLTLTRELESTKQQVDAMIGKLDQTVETNSGAVTDSLANLRYTLEVVSEHVDAITYNLEGTTRNMNEFSRQIRRNPGVLLRGTSSEAEAR